MKYCPICETRFDEEIIRFCTKDGTPLIEEAAPSFTELPSENIEEDDFGEITMIRRKNPVPPPPPNLDEGLPTVVPPGERIVIPTNQAPVEQAVRPLTTQTFYPLTPPPSDTAKTVILTVLGTVVVLGLGAGLFWFLQKDTALNKNTNANNANVNTYLNTNLAIDTNFNFNATPNYNTNYNLNLNTNFNANVKTPTPTPKPSPTVTPTPLPSPAVSPSPSPSKTPSFVVRPGGNTAPSPTPRSGPRPTPNRPPGNEN